MKYQTTRRKNMTKQEKKQKAWKDLEKRHKIKLFEKKAKTEGMKAIKFQIKVIAIVMICALAITSTSPIRANAKQTVKACVNVESRLNLRSNPSTDAQIIGKLYPNDIVTVVALREDDWARVITKEGQEGYVSSDFIVLMFDNVEEIKTVKEETKELKNEPKGELELLNTFAVAKEKSSSNRNFNMSKACDSINGLELAPGEKFDWYGVNGVGPADKAHGYKEATVLINGKPTSGYGGGVCQVATCLYNTIYGIGINADEHHPHSQAQPYVKDGMVEAAVAYGAKNFVFHNTKDYTIRFKAHVERYGENEKGGQVIISVFKVK